MPDPAGRPRTRPLIVVAEDGVAEGTMVRMMTELGGGYEVVIAVNGSDALAAIETHRPDAVVSDMNLPFLDALELCRAVRALPEGESVPVILWTSADAEHPQVLEPAGLFGVEVLSKGCTLREIDLALKQILRPTGMETTS